MPNPLDRLQEQARAFGVENADDLDREHLELLIEGHENRLREQARSLGLDPGDEIELAELREQVEAAQAEADAERQARERHDEIGRRAGRPLVDLTVKELHDLAKEFDVPTSGTKDELIVALGHDPEEMDEAARVKATRELVARENSRAARGPE